MGIKFVCPSRLRLQMLLIAPLERDGRPGFVKLFPPLPHQPKTADPRQRAALSHGGA